MNDQRTPIMFRPNDKDAEDLATVMQYLMDNTPPGVTLTQADVFRYCLSIAIAGIKKENQ